VILGAVAVLLACEPGHAFFVGGVRQGPWCAGQSIGWSWQENCTLPSLEICRREVIAGNRGVCFPNPSWAGHVQTPGKSRRTRTRR
jgi:hypothetical protein